VSNKLSPNSMAAARAVLALIQYRIDSPR